MTTDDPRVEPVARVLMDAAGYEWGTLPQERHDGYSRLATRALAAADVAERAATEDGIARRLADALKSAIEPTKGLLRHLRSATDDFNSVRAWNAGREALTRIERALAEYEGRAAP